MWRGGGGSVKERWCLDVLISFESFSGVLAFKAWISSNFSQIQLQVNFTIMLSFGSMETDCVISEAYYYEVINNRVRHWKITIFGAMK